MATIRELEAETARLLGMAISRWASIELSILSLFAATNHLPIQRAAAIASAFSGFATLFRITDKSIRERFQGDENAGLIHHWTQLSEYVNELSGDRNNMAHSPITIHSDKEPEWDAANTTAKVLVGPSPLLWLSDSHKRTLSADELRELDLDFVHALNCIAAFSASVSRGPPFPDKSSIQFERRRPPRSSRPQTRFPKPPFQL